MATVWLTSGILRPTRRHAAVPCSCGERHLAEVEEYVDAGKTRFVAYCPETGSSFSVNKSDLVTLTFDPQKMAEVLCTLFKCRDAVTEIMPGRLWKMGRSAVPIGGRSRDIYFAPRMNDNPGDVYARLPGSKTPLLIVGGSRFQKDSERRFDDHRIVSLDVALMIENNEWKLDVEWLNTLATDAPEPEQIPATRDASAKTVGDIKKALHAHLESAFRHYCDSLDKENGRDLLSPITQDQLAAMIGKSKARVSTLLELKIPIEKCSNLEIRAMWDACHDIDKMVAYGKKYWGRKHSNIYE